MTDLPIPPGWEVSAWRRFLELLDQGFASKGPLTTDAAAAYAVLLKGVDPASIERGLRRLLHRGHRWRPKAAEILEAAYEDPTMPTFDEAMQLMFAVPGGAVYENPRPCHPLVLSFVARQGAERLRRLPLDHPEYGELRRDDLRRSWDAHVKAMEGRETATLAEGGGDPRLLDPLRMAGLLPPTTDDDAPAQLESGAA